MRALNMSTVGLVVVAAFPVLGLLADTGTWQSSENEGNWGAAANWVEGVVPTVSEDDPPVIYMTNDVDTVQVVKGGAIPVHLYLDSIIGGENHVILPQGSGNASGKRYLYLLHPETFYGRFTCSKENPAGSGRTSYPTTVSFYDTTQPHIVRYADLNYNASFYARTNVTIRLDRTVGSGLVEIGSSVKYPGTVEFVDAPGAATYVVVNDGTLRLDGVATNAASGVVEGAWLHLDAAKSVMLDEDGETVASWGDISGNGNSAVPDTAIPLAAPRVATDETTGLRVISFGAFQSGKYSGTPYASWTDAHGDPSALKLQTAASGVRELFVVFRDLERTNSTPFFVGQGDLSARWNNNPFVRVLFSAGLFVSGKSVLRGDISENGQHCFNDAVDDRTRSPHVLSVRLEDGVADFTHLGYGYDTSKNTYLGGLEIGELIAYTNELTLAERRQVNAYLVGKWRTGCARTDWDAGLVSLPTATTPIDVPEGRVARIREVKAEGGTLVKTGEGDLVIGRMLSDGVSIDVQGGTVRMLNDQTEYSGAEKASDPAVWLDATQMERCEVTGEGDDKRIVTWADPRGANASGDAIYAMTNSSGSAFLTLVENGLNGNPVVDFGSAAASDDGVAANYRIVRGNAASAQYLAREFFIVAKCNDSSASPFSSTRADFNGASASRLLNSDYGSGVASSALWTLDGVPQDVPGSCALGTASYRLLSCHARAPLTMDILGLSGNAKRRGGVEIAEVLTYDRELTDEERQATLQYLRNKWLPDLELPTCTKPKTIATLSFAAGVERRIDIDSDMSVSYVDGDGAFVKSGSGSVTLSGFLPSDGASFDVRGGSLDLALDVCQGAAFHVDATRPTWDADVVGGVTNLLTWYDVHTNGVSAVSLGGSEKPCVAHPTLQTVDVNGSGNMMPVVDFGERTTFASTTPGIGDEGWFTNGCTAADMNWSTYKGYYQYQRTPFQEFHTVMADMVSDSVTDGNLHPQVLGSRTVNDPGCSYPFMRDGRTMLSFGSNNNRNEGLAEGYIGMNGSQIENVVLTQGVFSVFSFAPTGTLTAVGAFNRYSGNSFGGSRIGETVVFAATNTAARRMMIEGYLYKKWIDPDSELSHLWEFASMTVSDGASLSVTSDISERLSSSVFGGEGSIDLGGDVQNVGELRIDGDLSVAGGVALASGCQISVAASSSVSSGCMTVSGELSLPSSAAVTIAFPESTKIGGELEIMRADSISGAASLRGWTGTALPSGRAIGLRIVGNSVYAAAKDTRFMVIVR